MCDENDIPKVGDKIFLLVSYGTVVSLKKVADNYYEGKYDYYLGKVKEGLVRGTSKLGMRLPV